jgi:tRNA A37 N6-isopentenylltransferase MiaA
MHPSVLLIGGGSSVGKTTAARRLAQQFGCEVLNTDQLLPKGDPTFDPLKTSLEI